MCGQRGSRERAAERLRRSPVDPAARVGDAQRDVVVDDLVAAAGEGYLRPDEVDERTTRALAARTYADLDGLLSDLPAPWRSQRAAERGRTRAVSTAQRAARASLRPHVTAYAGVMAVLVAVWLVVGLTAGAWYPWPLWPALFWGFSVAGHVRTARARPGLPARA